MWVLMKYVYKMGYIVTGNLDNARETVMSLSLSLLRNKKKHLPYKHVAG